MRVFKFITIAVLLLIVFSVALWCLFDIATHAPIPPAETKSAAIQAGVRRKMFSETMDEPSDFMSVMQIWHCDDGSFELRTSIQSVGRYPTIELAREAKTNWANEVSARIKANKANGSDDGIFKSLPDCGKRVE